jgi:hypothetical protein
MHPIAEQIIAGVSFCPSTINQSNADRIMVWVRATDTHHTPADCHSGKDCVHSPGIAMGEWAATLVAEAEHVCTCGEHGTDNPAQARAVRQEWIDRW